MYSRQRIARRMLAEHCAIAERLRTDPHALLDFARGNADRWASSFPLNLLPDWLTQWQQLLAGPLDELLDVLTADTEAAARLRTSSPVLGLLTFDEKLDILRKVDPEMARNLALFMLTYGQFGSVIDARAKR